MNPLIAIPIVALCCLLAAHLLVTLREWAGSWSRRARLAILLVPLAAFLAWENDWLSGGWALLIVVATGLLAWRRLTHNAEIVQRRGQQSRRKHGVASWVDVLRHGSAWKIRRKARVLRPSLAAVTRWELLRTARTEFAYRIGRCGIFWVWGSIEHVTLIFGGPRRGKSAYLAARILEAPGCVVSASTRADLHEVTATKRAERGPVYVFNPVGLGDDDKEPLPTTLPFDPLIGCQNPTSAFQRATDLMGMSGSNDKSGGSDRGYWEIQARRVLTALLHAAAIGNRSMLTVYRWVADPEAHKAEIMNLLLRGDVAAYVPDVEQFVGTNPDTRTSITTGIMPALGWLTSEPAVKASAPGAKFDVAKLLTERAAIYLIGDEETQSAPLVRALTGYLVREARRLAGRYRLDPPLTLAMDEAGLLAPPLEKWTADMGGRGVTIVAAFQSRAQMLTRWSPAEAGTIQNNAGTTILLGGTGDEADLRYWALRIGERDEPVATDDKHGKATSRTVRKVPVLSPTQINALPEFQAVVFHHGMPPALCRIQPGWERPEMRPGSIRNRFARLRARTTAPATHQQVAHKVAA